MTGGGGGSAKRSYEMKTRSVVAPPGRYGHSGQQPGPLVRGNGGDGDTDERSDNV